MTTPVRQRPRVARILAALAAAGLVAGVVVRAREHLADRAARGRIDETRAAWLAATTAMADETTTYAAVLPGPGAAAWAEVLAAAGVPVPAVLAADPEAGELPDAYRLVVVWTSDAGRAEALARTGRAVVQVDDSARAETPAGATLRIGDVAVPLAGAAAAALAPGPAETAFMTGPGGAAATVRAAGAGVVVRLGVDLAALLVRLRQGEPGRAGVDSDGNGAVQPADLLPPFDPALAARPFADLAVAALLRTIDEAFTTCTLPRLRGLPAGAHKLVVLTADQDYAPDDVLGLVADRLEDAGARATFLLTDPGAGAPADLNVGPGKPAPRASAETVRLLARRGFGLGIHAFPRRSDDVTAVAERFAALTGAPPLAARNHHLRWEGFQDTALAGARGGVVMNLDFMAVCAGDRPCAAFPGGAAQPIRFVAPSGQRLPVLQQPTAVDDYSLRLEDPARRRAAADALGMRARALLDAAAAADAPLVVNAHPYLYAVEPTWLEPLLETAQVVSAETWLDFVVQRRRARVSLATCERPSLSLPAGTALIPSSRRRTPP